MPLEETQAIVLRSDPLGEADKIVTFYTPQFGRIRAVAQGARRAKSRFGSNLEVLTHLQLVFFAKPSTNLHRVSQTDLLMYFSNLRQDLSQLVAALYLVDLVYSFTASEDSHPELFQLLSRTLQLLDAGQESSVLLRIFEIRLLTLLGYAPQLDCCVSCQKELDLKQEIVYNLLKGGGLCFACSKGQGGLSLSGGSINFLKQATKVDLSKISRLKLSASQTQEIKRMLHEHLCCHLKQDIKSYRFLEQF